jgi:hypothetical protein
VRLFASGLLVGCPASRSSASMGHEPWNNLGLYGAVELAPKWQHFEFTFVATGDDENARIQFDLGGSDVAVEFSAVRLWSLSNGTSVEPDFLKTYFSPDYRRNCPRGHEGLELKSSILVSDYRCAEYGFPVHGSGYRFLVMLGEVILMPCPHGRQRIKR